MLRDPFDIDFSEVLKLKKLKYGSSERSVYRKLTKSILNEDKILFLRGKDYSAKSIKRVLVDVMTSNPLTFGVKKIDVTNNGKGTCVYFEYLPQMELLKEKIRERVKELYESMSISRCRTELKIELTVNDWMCQNCSYCMDMGYLTKHSVIGILLEGRGVCGSFALCTSLLLNCFGVKCFSISGELKNPGTKDNFKGMRPKEYMDELSSAYGMDSRSNELLRTKLDMVGFNRELGFEQYDYEDFVSHAWNYVVIEGRERHLDVSFNNGHHIESSRKSKHSFFNLTDDEISEDRIVLFGPGKNKKNR